MLHYNREVTGTGLKTKVRRLEELIEILKEGYTTVSQLSKSGERRDTIRRDILNLQKETFSVKCFDDDSIVSFPLFLKDTEMYQDIEKHLPEKRAVAKYVVEEMINYGDTIFLDSGSTILQIALCLTQSPFTDITIITHNLYILSCLSTKFKKLKITGGFFDRERSILLKSSAYDFKKEELKKSFISLTGLSYDRGVLCEPRLTESKKQAILATKELVVFVLDHSKIGQTQTGKAFISFEELEENGKNYCIVADNNVPNKDRTSFEQIKGKFPKERFISVSIS